MEEEAGGLRRGSCRNRTARDDAPFCFGVPGDCCDASVRTVRFDARVLPPV